ncbi:hypothetical protein PoB_004309700 [Plakobranchus ocellatus]|uniref:Uncharacterized protein n=1 Tax=Plakobranchus ocellatus TaxID=259542 RepID=A0AAV4BCB8_9GAST|nr:hypothetical protein PoB_004309700 [Plakobranchus ocellatus]
MRKYTGTKPALDDANGCVVARSDGGRDSWNHCKHLRSAREQVAPNDEFCFEDINKAEQGTKCFSKTLVGSDSSLEPDASVVEVKQDGSGHNYNEYESDDDDDDNDNDDDVVDDDEKE